MRKPVINLVFSIVNTNIEDHKFISKRAKVISVPIAFNTDIDSVVKFFILILIFVFDPLAVSLVIAANIAFEKSSLPF